ncbi:MAG: hypothetical protein D6729_04485 [Deltaproteobacteria bacterium]|nr:MAG: hypothetical protein D6729_04485 [Deltaproteobacteria bacterium]
MGGRRRILVVLVAAGVVGIALGALLGSTDTEVGGLEVDTGALLRPVAQTEAPPPEPAPPPALDGLPVYPGAKPNALGDSVAAGGVPLSVAWFETPDPIEDVMAWYEKKLSENDYLVVGHAFSGASGYVGYRESENGVMHVVTMIRQGEGTMVIPSKARTGDLLQVEQRLPEWLPAPEGAQGAMIVEVGESGSQQESVSAFVEGGDILELIDFYRKALGARGWQVERSRRESPLAGRVDASRPGQRLSLFLSRPSATDATVQLYATLVRTT